MNSVTFPWPVRSIRSWVCLLGVVVGTGSFLDAHECGELSLKVAVNRRVYYRINADVRESQDSVYDVFLNSDPAVAPIAPQHQSTKGYAEFVFTGNKLGITTATIKWSYAPNNASGECSVDVEVVPFMTMPIMSAANYHNATHTADPVNLFTGELVLAEEPDLNLGGPMPLYFSRYHASGLKRDGLVFSTLGPNWSHNFDTRLVPAGSEIDVITDKGRLITFTNSQNAWQLTGNRLTPFQLIQTPTNYVMLDPQDRRFYTFNTNGQLTAIADGKGNVHTLTYNGQTLTQVSDGLGRALTFDTESFNQLFSVSDGTRTVSFGYSFDGFGNLARVTDANGRISTYTYDNFNGEGSLLASKQLPEFNVPVAQKYDSDGRVIAQIVGGTLTNRFEYQANHITVATDPRGFSRRYTHDAQGGLLSVMDEAGRNLGYTYDADGRLATIIDRRGGVTRYTYHSASGEPASVIAADGTTNTYGYTPRTVGSLTVHDLTSRRGPDGALEQYSYDALGNRVRFVDALGQTWRYGYNGNGQVLNETNPLNAVISYSYNGDGTPASLIYPSIGTNLFAYDALRRLTRENHSDGTSRLYAYDALDHTVRMTNELGGVTSFVFDGNGRLVRETNEVGFVSTFAYNTADQLVGLVDPYGRMTRLLYEERGFLKGIVDRLGHTNLYETDALGDLVSYTDPLANKWRRAYAPESVPLATTNPIGQVVRFAADPLRRYTQITSPLGNAEHIGYDAAGRVTESVSPSGRTTEERYDLRGDVLATSHPAAAMTLEYKRNALGNATNVIDPLGGIWRQGFDNYGRLVSRTDPLGRARTYEHDGRGRVTRANFPGGLGSLQVSYDGINSITRRLYSDGVDLNYQYSLNGMFMGANAVTLGRDANGGIANCNGLAIARDGEGAIINLTVAPGKSLGYTYDARQLLVRVSDWLGGVTTFTYDAAGRLQTMTRPNGITTTNTIDADQRLTGVDEGSLASIRLTRNADGEVVKANRQLPLAPNLSAATMLHTFDPADQRLGFKYDALGRLTNDTLRSYVWDAASRLTRYTEGGGTVSFVYDAIGNRISRSDNTSTQTFVWNYALRLPSVTVLRQDGADVRYFVHTPEGLLLYSIEAVSGERRFHHFDEMGNTIFLTDDAGVVIAKYAYGPYGELLGHQGTVANSFTFQGQFGVMQEGTSGLYYMRARYYDSATARFLTHDAFRTELPRASNPYQYALGSPTFHTDPLGLSATQLKPKPTPPPAAKPPPVIVVNDYDFRREVRRMKRVLEKRAQASWLSLFDPRIPAAFDSKYLELQGQQYSFRGRTMNGGELNYYFQGMYWKEAGYDKGVMLAAMFGWKGVNYGTTPSSNDIFAACQGYNDTSTFFAELRDDAVSIVENLVGVPPGSTASVLSPLNNAGAVFGAGIPLGQILPR